MFRISLLVLRRRQLEPDHDGMVNYVEYVNMVSIFSPFKYAQGTSLNRCTFSTVTAHT